MSVEYVTFFVKGFHVLICAFKVRMLLISLRMNISFLFVDLCEKLQILQKVIFQHLRE